MPECAPRLGRSLALPTRAHLWRLGWSLALPMRSRRFESIASTNPAAPLLDHLRRAALECGWSPRASWHSEAQRAKSMVEIICNGQPRRVAAGQTVADLLAELGLSPRQVAVEVNLELVPRGLHAQRTLGDGDRLEVVSLVGGG